MSKTKFNAAVASFSFGTNGTSAGNQNAPGGLRDQAFAQALAKPVGLTSALAAIEKTDLDCFTPEHAEQALAK